MAKKSSKTNKYNSKREVYEQENMLEDFETTSTYVGSETLMARFQARMDANKWAAKYISYNPQKPLSKDNVRYVRVPTDKLEQFLKYILLKPVVAVDIETTGFSPIKDRILSVQFSYRPHEAYLVSWDDLSDHYKERRIFHDFLVSKDVLKIFHNSKFDLRFLCHKLYVDKARKYERKIIHSVRDTYLLAYMILGEPSKEDGENLRLKNLVRRLLQMDMKDFDGLGGLDIDTDGGFVYSVRDADATLQLYHFLMEKCPDNLDTVSCIEHRSVIGTIELERNGVLVIPELIEEFRDRMVPVMDELQQKIHKHIPWSINIDSKAMLSYYFFEKCGIPIPTGLKEKAPRKDGKPSRPSVDKNVLKIIQDKHPAIPLLLEYSRLKTLVTGFTVKLIKMLDGNNELFASFMQTGTDTGRTSMRNPNTQQIPKSAIDMGADDDEFVSAIEEVNFRNIFRPRKGYKYIKADFSSQEVYMSANLSMCSALLKVCREGHDLHSVYAIKAFNLKHKETCELLEPFDKQHQKYIKKHYKAYRNTAKTIVFATLYGAGKNRIFSLIMSNDDWEQYFNLDEDQKRFFMSAKYKEAERLIKEFFALFPGLRKYHDKLKKYAEDHKNIRTSLGRVRFLDVTDPKGGWKRQAVNTPIQGSCADVLKHVLYQLAIALEPYDARMVLSVHDEIVVECRDDQVEQVTKVMVQVMEHGVKDFIKYELDFKVEADPSVSWGITIPAANRYLTIMKDRGNVQAIDRFKRLYDYELTPGPPELLAA